MNSAWLGLVGRAAVPAAVFAVYAVLRRRLPVRSRENNLAPPPPELLDSFRRTRWYLGIALLGVGIALGLSLYFSLVALNQHYADAEGPARFQLLPTRVIWGFFPAFAALTLCWEIALALWSFAGDRAYISQYLDWSDQQAGFDSTRALRWLALLVALPIGIATAPAIPMHSTLHDSELQVRGYASIAPTILRYSDVRRVFQVAGFRDRSGKMHQRTEIIIEFQDGRRWHSGENREFALGIDPALAEFLMQRTGVVTEYFDTEADIPAQTNAPGNH